MMGCRSKDGTQRRDARVSSSWSKRILCLAPILLAGLGPVSGYAQEPFRGKQVRLIVGAPPGGGYDAYARLLGNHIGRHIPGNPVVIVQNMPGAASITLVNHLVNAAPRDGGTIGAVLNLTGTFPMLFPTHAKFDARDLNWIGSMLRETGIALARTDAKIKDLRDATNKEVVVAGSTGATNSFPSFSNAFAGTKFKIVLGYPGTRDGMLAVERKEVDALVGITYASVKATSAEALQDGKINLFIQFGLRRHPDLPGVSWIFDHARTDDDKAAMELMFSPQEFGRPFVLPPAVTADTIKMMRSAFDSTMTDPNFLDEAARRKMDIDPVTGIDIATMVAKLAKTPPHIVNSVRALVGDVP